MTLEESVDKVLIEGMKQSLKDAIDGLVSRGRSKREIMRHCRKITGPRGRTTLGAIEAYLATK